MDGAKRLRVSDPDTSSGDTLPVKICNVAAGIFPLDHELSEYIGGPFSVLAQRIARQTATSAWMFIPCFMTIVSTLLGPFIRVSPSPKHSSWMVTTVIHTVVCAFSGAGKSNVHSLLLRAVQHALDIFGSELRAAGGTDDSSLLQAAKNLPSLFDNIESRPDKTVLAFYDEIRTLFESCFPGFMKTGDKRGGDASYGSRADVIGLLDGRRWASGTISHGHNRVISNPCYGVSGYIQPKLLLGGVLTSGNNNDGALNRFQFVPTLHVTSRLADIAIDDVGQQEELTAHLVEHEDRRVIIAECLRRINAPPADDSVGAVGGTRGLADSQSIPSSQDNSQQQAAASTSGRTPPMSASGGTLEAHLVQIFLDFLHHGHRFTVVNGKMVAVPVTNAYYMGSAKDVATAKERSRADKVADPRSGYEEYEEAYDDLQAIIEQLQVEGFGEHIGIYSKSKELIMKLSLLLYFIDCMLRRPDNRVAYGSSPAAAPRRVVPTTFVKLGVRLSKVFLKARCILDKELASCSHIPFPNLHIARQVHAVMPFEDDTADLDVLDKQLADGDPAAVANPILVAARNAAPKHAGLVEGSKAYLINKMFTAGVVRADMKKWVVDQKLSYFNTKKPLGQGHLIAEYIELVELCIEGSEEHSIPKLLVKGSKWSGSTKMVSKIVPAEGDAAALVKLTADLGKVGILLRDWFPDDLLEKLGVSVPVVAGSAGSAGGAGGGGGTSGGSGPVAGPGVVGRSGAVGGPGAAGGSGAVAGPVDATGAAGTSGVVGGGGAAEMDGARALAEVENA